MTVAQLIERLRAYDADMPVMVLDSEWGAEPTWAVYTRTFDPERVVISA